MSTKDFTANVISATKVVPDGNFKDSKASGIWDINEALDLIKGGNWPNAANIDPASFVDALFQTHLYNGNEGTQTITNNVDLTKGGLVWLKRRDSTQDNGLFDTERGVGKYVQSNGADTEASQSTSLTSFNSNGFTLGSFNLFNDESTRTYCAWTFRKQPKFFDVVKYEGTGSARTVAHSLGTTVGMIIVKNLDAGDNWAVFHRGIDHNSDGAPETDGIYLNLDSDTVDEVALWNDTAPTSSVFTVGTDHTVNASGENYIAYLFAHNNDDGGFGEPGDQDIIKCDTYDAASAGTTVTLGFEPQWIIIKKVNASESWYIYDSMRGVATGGDNSQDKKLRANSSGGEGAVPSPIIAFSSTGFVLESTDNEINGSGGKYIYMAIRRGGMQTPTAASDVFAVDTMANQTPAFDSTFPVDMVIRRNVGGVNTNTVWARITGQSYLNTNGGDAASNDVETFDSNVGFGDGSTYSDNHAYMWARARGYFDALCYTGTGSARTVAHNLGVVPEMIWIKNRGAAENWVVYHSGIDSSSPQNFYLRLNQNGARINIDGGAGNRFNQTAPTASVFTVGTDGDVNGSGVAYIAHLFATVAGVSKVGSFTQSGATNVACGFTGSTPALIILRRTDSTGDWYLFDSLRGIVAGNDPYFILNDTTAPTTNADMVDPYSGGFATTSNIANGDYIFYAIAAIS